jgi:hypothetical protein
MFNTVLERPIDTPRTKKIVPLFRPIKEYLFINQEK